MSVDGPQSRVSSIACRQIVSEDEACVVALLSAGFDVRSSDYWTAAFATLRDRDLPGDCPRYGYCLTADGEIVGLILLIYSTLPHDPGALRCSVSSWYVIPRFRIYASLLVNAALRIKHSTYINSSSVANTRQTVMAQGFSCFARGQFLALAALGGWVPKVRVRRIPKEALGSGDADIDLLATHAGYGCISLLCTIEGSTYPFMFLRRKVPHIHVPCAQLIYCRDVDSFVRLQGPIGRYLLTRGMPLVMLDANEPFKGLIGRYFEGRGPKFFLGKSPPRIGDLAYSEAVLFGP